MNEFIKSHSDNEFTLMHVGYETSIHLKYIGDGFRVDLLVPIEDVVSSMNQNKKGVFRINDVVQEGEKVKPSFMEFKIGENTIEVNANGPDDKNKTKTATVIIDKNNFLTFIKKSVELYRDMVAFEAVGDSKVDKNKLSKKIDKLNKFISKVF